MWQNKPLNLAHGAVLLGLTAALLVVKPDPGLAQNRPIPDNIYAASSDPSLKQIHTKSKLKNGMLLAAIENPLPRRSVKKAPEPAKKAPQVASVTSYKPPQTPAPAPEDIKSLINKYATKYGANPAIMTIIAKCESGFNPNAINPSGAFHGMYQFVPSTWQSNRRAMGLSDDLSLMYNAEEAIKTAAFKMGRDGYGAWPACQRLAFSQLSLK